MRSEEAARPEEAEAFDAFFNAAASIRRRHRAAAPDVARVGHLVSRVEIACLLGVSQQRVHQIINAGPFPAPIADLAIGQVWEAAAVRQWAREVGRHLRDDE